MLASVEVQTALLVLKICFLVLLYLFIWRIVRSASRDVRMPQESFIMGPQQAAAAGLGRQPQAIDSGVLVTVRSNAARAGVAVRAEREGDHPRARRRRTTSASATTSSPPAGTRASSRAATASGSRTSARPTARS